MTKYVIGLVAAALLVMTLLAGSVIGLREVSPAPGSVVSQSSPKIEVGYYGLATGAQVLIDRRTIPLEGRPSRGKMVAIPGNLADGRHTVAVEINTFLGRRAGRLWEFEVDGRPPVLEIEFPKDGDVTSEKNLVVRGTSDPNAQVHAGSQSVTANSEGRFDLTLELSSGANQVVLTSADGAGNQIERRLEIFLDDVAPEVKVQGPTGRVKKDPPVLVATVRDDQQLEQVRVSVDKKPAQVLEPDKEGKITLTLEGLPEGERSVEVRAVDRAGNATDKNWKFILDSTEKFGDKVTTVGAEGKDVKILKRRLAALGYLDSTAVNTKFDEQTQLALIECQKAHQLHPDGVVGPNVVAVLGPKVFVNLKKFELALEEPGGPVIRYGIAHGLPKHETPTGSFYISEKIADPTWIPPDSAWAKEAEVTPPGAENPLGTRWLGLNTGLLGIHGTPYSWSIGTQASHGCIRLRTKEVEKLYEQVGVGTEVTIFKGDENDPARQRLWP